MPTFSYQAINHAGKDTLGTLEATNRNDAVAAIRKRGLQPLSVVEGSSRADKRPTAQPAEDSGNGSPEATEPIRAVAPRRRGGRRVSKRELPAFTRQMGTLLKAGIPVMQALSVLSEQCESEGMSKLTLEVRESIAGGASLSEALSDHPKLFNRLYVNMVNVGEQGGVLDEVLTQLTSFLEADRELRSSLTTALVYPVVVLSLGFLSVLTLTLFVIPQLSELFNDFGANLPFLTRAMIGTSSFLITWWWLVIFLGGGAAWAARWILQSEELREKIDVILLQLPLLGPLLTKAHIARFSRTMGTLVSSGIPVLVSVELVAETTDSSVFRHALRNAGERIRKGEGIAEPLRQQGIFPPMVTNMIGVGEQSGSLDDMLLQIAGAYDVELQQALKRFITILEPTLILLLAIVVGTIIAAFLFPILSLSEVLS